jgi:hypothetical protein
MSGKKNHGTTFGNEETKLLVFAYDKSLNNKNPKESIAKEM